MLQLANNFSAINCSNTLWAFASLRHYSPPLFTALLERLGCHLEEVEPQNVANALYALARVSHPLGDHAGVAAWSGAEAAKVLVRSCTLLLAGGFLACCLIRAACPACILTQAVHVAGHVLQERWWLPPSA